MLTTKEIIHAPIEITLVARQVWSITGNRGDMISCSKGSLWITQEADPNDYVVEAGKDLWVTKSGCIVVEALKDAQFKYRLNELDNHIKDTQQLTNIQRIRA